MGTSTYKSSKKRLMHACLAENMWKMTHSMLDYIYCTSLIVSTGLFKFEQDEPKKTLLLSILQMVLSFLLCLSLSNCKEWQQCKTAPTYCNYTKTPQGLRRTKPHTHTHKNSMSMGIDGWKYKYCCTELFIIIFMIKFYSSS